MKKVLNRNHLKLIAIITMLIDHVGILLSPILPPPVYYAFRAIGRIAFPIFAFFIAEGFYYTHNKTKYFSRLAIFAIISELPYFLFLGGNQNLIYVNVLFTFLIAMLLMALYDKLYRENNYANKINFFILLFLVLIIIFILPMVNIALDYGMFGVMLTLMFYIFKNKRGYAIISFVTLLLIKFTFDILSANIITFNSFILLFEVLTIPLILLYNGKKGKLNTKWLFYWFYPLHLLMLYIIKIIIY